MVSSDLLEATCPSGFVTA